jgi:type II secretory pathway component PulF
MAMNKKRLNKFEKMTLKMSFGPNERMKLYEKISSFLDQGEPIVQTIKALAEEYSSQKKHFGLSTDDRGKILSDWAMNLDEAKSFAESIREWVPASEVMIIESGEVSGKLSDSLVIAAETSLSMSKIKGSLIGKSAYPIFLLISALTIVYFFAKSGIPTLTKTLSVDHWPPVAKALYSFSMFIEQWLFIGGGLFLLVAILIGLSMPRMIGKVRNTLDVIPPWSIYKEVQSAVFLRSLSSMMKTGVPVGKAMTRLRDLSPPYVMNKIREMLSRLNTGSSAGEAIYGNFLSSESKIDVKIYGNLSNLENAMSTIGVRAIDDVIRKVEKVMGVVFIVSIFMMFSYVGWLLLAVFSLQEAMKMASKSGLM